MYSGSLDQTEEKRKTTTITTCKLFFAKNQEKKEGKQETEREKEEKRTKKRRGKTKSAQVSAIFKLHILSNFHEPGDENH